MSARRILSRAELDRLRTADRILAEAETTRQQSREQGARLQQEMLGEARLAALREATRTASRLIAQAEAAAEARLRNIEPELARLVARTVRSILGEFEPEEASYLAARQALARLRDHRHGRIFADPGLLAPINRAVDALGADGPEILSVAPDPALEPGRALLTSDRGSAEIGLAAMIDRALAPWERPEAEDRPAAGARGPDDPLGPTAATAQGDA